MLITHQTVTLSVVEYSPGLEHQEVFDMGPKRQEEFQRVEIRLGARVGLNKDSGQKKS